jgi:proline iminopeptidase
MIMPVFGETQETYIELGNAKLFCRTMGKGSPLIVLHGGPGLSQNYLLPQLEALAKNHLVIFYDQRGSGESTGEISPETINIETFVQDLESLRKALHLDKISILGHSWGGFLAMSYAISHPEMIEKLILVSSMPPSSEEFALFAKEWTIRLAPFQQTLQETHNSPLYKIGDPETIENLHRLIFRTYCYLPEKAALLNLRASPQASINGSKVHLLLRENLFQTNFNLRPALEQLHIPTLIIHGDVDPVPSSTAENLHKSVQGSQLIIMQDCGHFLMYMASGSNLSCCVQGLKIRK